MTATVFDTVRASVDIVDVARRYGIAADNHNKACCPFHNEKTPSFVLYPKTHTFYCFGCGERGDALDIVMHTGGARTPIEAAGELNRVYGLGLDLNGKIDPAEARKREQERERLQAFKEWERKTCNTWAAYCRMLRSWKQNHAPRSAEEKTDPRYIEACHRLDYADYIFQTVFIDGCRDMDTQTKFYKEHQQEVRRIEQFVSRHGTT